MKKQKKTKKRKKLLRILGSVHTGTQEAGGVSLVGGKSEFGAPPILQTKFGPPPPYTHLEFDATPLHEKITHVKRRQ